MRTYKKIINMRVFAVLFFVSMVFVSCQDFLEEQPSTLIDSNYVYTTEEGLESGVVSLYTFYRDRYDNNVQDYMGSVLLQSRSDLAFVRSGYTGLIGRYQRFVSPVDLGSQFASSLFWKNFFKLSSKATDLINAAENLEGLDPEVRDQVIAEAKFFRAESYFILYRMYNNIYVTTESVTVDNAFAVIQDRSTDAEIFDLINSDLDFAIEHLDWDRQFGRVTKGTAKHVKAKVAMWEGDWEEAKTQALDVIESPDSPHSLVSSTSNVFSGDLNNSEQLMTVQIQDDLLGGGAANMMSANLVTQYFQISGIESNVEQGGRGFSRVLPNLYLLNLLAEDENDNRDDDTYFRLKYFYTSGPEIGQQIQIYGPITEEDPDGNNVTRYYQRLHPSCIKFANDDDDPTNYRQTSNIMVYRLAETYLIAAEAMIRSSGDALPYINAIRERANASPVTSADLQTILDERARELSFEGQRWFTIKRFGQETMNFQMRNFAGDGEFFPNNFNNEKDPRLNWQDHFINFPIAQDDINLLGPGYPQNDGY